MLSWTPSFQAKNAATSMHPTARILARVVNMNFS